MNGSVTLSRAMPDADTHEWVALCGHARLVINDVHATGLI